MTSMDDEKPGLAPNCRYAEDAPGYVLGWLSKKDAVAFRSHMESCGTCARAATTARQIIERLRADPDEACADDLAEKVMADIRTWSGTDMNRGRETGERVARLARAAAVILLLLGIGALLVARRGAERMPQAAGTGVGLAVPPGLAEEPAARSGSGASLDKALTWLVKAQEPDGRWASASRGVTNNYDVGVSGLALMALLGGEPPAGIKGEASEAIRSGVNFLIAQQAPSGLFGPVFSGATYNHGLATLAMVHACARDTNSEWRAAAERGVRFITTIQDVSGGWNYLCSSPGTVNSSASVWPLVALIRAESAGFKGLNPSVQRGLRWMQAAVNGDGLMGYYRVNDAPDGYDTLTAAGAMCLLRGKRGVDSQVLDSMLPKVRKLATEAGGKVDFYRTFFVSEALALVQDSGSEPAVSMNTRLLAMQQHDGMSAGSWSAHDDKWGMVGGPVYSTALAAMSLNCCPGGVAAR